MSTSYSITCLNPNPPSPPTYLLSLSHSAYHHQNLKFSPSLHISLLIYFSEPKPQTQSQVKTLVTTNIPFRLFLLHLPPPQSHIFSVNTPFTCYLLLSSPNSITCLNYIIFLHQHHSSFPLRLQRLHRDTHLNSPI